MRRSEAANGRAKTHFGREYPNSFFGLATREGVFDADWVLRQKRGQIHGHDELDFELRQNLIGRNKMSRIQRGAELGCIRTLGITSAIRFV